MSLEKTKERECFLSIFLILYIKISELTPPSIGFGGLEVACWPLVPKFVGSNPAEAVGFFG
jgi:hypothetical protein